MYGYMRKKTQNLILLFLGFGLVIAFLQTVYSYFYYSLPASINPTEMALQARAFMEPNNLSIFSGILFFVGIMLVVLFERE